MGVTSTHEKQQARRAELVRRLTDLAPKHRLDAMLEEVDGKALVRSIAAEDVYSTIIDVGLADSTEIVQLATPEQFRTFIDLAAWQKDRIDPLEVLHWLRAARGGDDHEFIRKLQGLDLEILEFLYRKLTIVHDLQENPDVDTQGVTMETPDGVFLLEFKIDGVDEAALRRLTQDIMANNPFELSRFLEAIRWEMPTELEEAAFQFRQARLQDLGFPPLEEAVKVFAWVDPDKVTPARPSGAPVVLPATVGNVDYVSAMFKSLDATERQNLEGETRYLVNCVLMAEGAEPGDPAAIRRFSEAARDSLNLGLEQWTGGDVELASDVVRDHSLREIFQVGFSLTLKLKRQVERMAREPSAKFGETWLAMDEETAMLAALLRRRPLKALKVPGAEPVTFRSKRELAETEASFARVRAQRSVLAGLLGAAPAATVAHFGVSLSELTPQRLFAAVVMTAELDQVVQVAPFSAMRLQELTTRIFEEVGPSVKLRASAGQRAAAVIGAKLPDASPAELRVMVDRVMNALLNDVGAAWAKEGRVDPKRVIALPIVGELPV